MNPERLLSFALTAPLNDPLFLMQGYLVVSLRILCRVLLKFFFSPLNFLFKKRGLTIFICFLAFLIWGSFPF